VHSLQIEYQTEKDMPTEPNNQSHSSRKSETPKNEGLKRRIVFVSQNIGHSCSVRAPFLPMLRKGKWMIWVGIAAIFIIRDRWRLMSTSKLWYWQLFGRYTWSAGLSSDGIISQPDWHSKDDFMQLGEPKFYFWRYGWQYGFDDKSIHRRTKLRLWTMHIQQVT